MEEATGTNFSFPYTICSDLTELSSEDQGLLDRALEASKLAYAPFSEFNVGSAVLLETGEIVTGNNQENRAFNSGICAERVALFSIGSQGNGDKVRKIAIRAWSKNIEVNKPVTPCGACRQVMLEYEKLGKTPIKVLMQGAKGNVLIVEGVSGRLLPFDFDIDF